MCGIAHNNSRVARVPPRNAVASCPSVSSLRDSHGYIESHTYTFGAEFPPTFQSCLTRLRFLVPERFRAISPSAALKALSRRQTVQECDCLRVTRLHTTCHPLKQYDLGVMWIIVFSRQIPELLRQNLCFFSLRNGTLCSKC
ncbi:hypothetical protein CEV33_4066 [Brucella grignonensis]|uniref:Uncharacterized protein n=1 Tax=Brucella grignonensis TaxID=94627 RepID=A0A256FR85_9HYPH|nr:hypothetical protein CEV33_4066 [Brucella grignonensis]